MPQVEANVACPHRRAQGEEQWEPMDTSATRPAKVICTGCGSDTHPTKITVRLQPWRQEHAVSDRGRLFLTECYGTCGADRHRFSYTLGWPDSRYTEE